jgi:hypothetical protein
MGWVFLLCLLMIVPLVGFIAYYVGYFVLLSYMYVAQAAFYLAVSGQIQPMPVNMQYNQNYNANGYGQGNMMQNNMPQNNVIPNNIDQNNIQFNNGDPNNYGQNNDELNGF